MSAVSITAMPHVVASAFRAAGHGIADSAHNFIEQFGDALSRSIAESECERDEAYLAESTGRFDLERRMRALDYGRKGDAWWPC